MSVLLVVDRFEDWPLTVPGVEVVSARKYITDASYSALRGIKVFNLSRSYKYQSAGYYVSLLAAARGQKPLPSVSTIQDLRYRSLIRVISEELETLIQESLAPITSDQFVLSIYFGRNVAKRYSRLCIHLFNLFPAPLLRAHFRRESSTWHLQSLAPIAAREIPEDHKSFVIAAIGEYFTKGRSGVWKRNHSRYDLAILHDPTDEEAPSNDKALRHFAKAGHGLGFRVEFIGADDIGRIAEFDALFIRETTSVNHHTYRFSRRAAAESLVVIDDPDSILRCTNKVFLAELLARAKMQTPKTLMVHRDNIDTVAKEIGFPCILKLPDSYLSQGVVRIDDEAAFGEQALRYLENSELIIVQEYLPTEFDWRVGVLDRKALYACKYFMAKSHWQIIKRDGAGESTHYGRVEAVPVEMVPKRVIRTAVKAAGLIGDGLYGVDLKEKGNQCLVIEINDNPSIDAGFEDRLLGDSLYRSIMEIFLKRVEWSKEGRSLS